MSFQACKSSLARMDSMADRNLKDRSVGRRFVETLVEKKETISFELAPRSENNASQTKASDCPFIFLVSSSLCTFIHF